MEMAALQVSFLFPCFRALNFSFSLKDLGVKLIYFQLIVNKINSNQELWLYDCGLECVPASIAKLTNLQKLWLDHNNIRSIPKEMSCLVNLKVS